MSMDGQLHTLGALPVGIENKTRLIHRLEQDHAHDSGRPLGVHRGQGHGVGLIDLGGVGLLYPGLKKVNGIAHRCDSAIIQRSANIAHDARAVASCLRTG